MLFLDHLKDRIGLSAPAIAEKIRREVYAELNILSAAPKPDTIAAYFAGKRPLPIDPPGVNTPSWLMAAEMCFPGSSRYFFHPLPNLLAGPIESTEKVRTRQKRIPQAWIDQALRLGNAKGAEEDEKYNASLDKRPRIREGSHSSPDPLAWVHANMYALVPEVRVILLTRSGLARGWRRKFDPIDHEIEQLKSTHGFEALTAAFALHQEANLIKDTNRSEKSRQLLLELLVILDHDNTLRRVRKAFRLAIEHALSFSSFARYGPEAICVETLPSSWKGIALHLMRMQRYTPTD